MFVFQMALRTAESRPYCETASIDWVKKTAEFTLVIYPKGTETRLKIRVGGDLFFNTATRFMRGSTHPSGIFSPMFERTFIFPFLSNQYPIVSSEEALANLLYQAIHTNVSYSFVKPPKEIAIVLGQAALYRSKGKTAAADRLIATLDIEPALLSAMEYFSRAAVSAERQNGMLGEDFTVAGHTFFLHRDATDFDSVKIDLRERLQTGLAPLNLPKDTEALVLEELVARIQAKKSQLPTKISKTPSTLSVYSDLTRRSYEFFPGIVVAPFYELPDKAACSFETLLPELALKLSMDNRFNQDVRARASELGMDYDRIFPIVLKKTEMAIALYLDKNREILNPYQRIQLDLYLHKHNDGIRSYLSANPFISEGEKREYRLTPREVAEKRLELHKAGIEILTIPQLRRAESELL